MTPPCHVLLCVGQFPCVSVGTSAYACPSYRAPALPSCVLPSNQPWVQDADPRVELFYGDAAKTGLEDNSASLVSLSLVVHELSTEGRRTVREINALSCLIHPRIKHDTRTQDSRVIGCRWDVNTIRPNSEIMEEHSKEGVGRGPVAWKTVLSSKNKGRGTSAA